MFDWQFLSWAFGAATFVYLATRLPGEHLNDEARQSVALWLNEQEEDRWARQFGVIFDTLMGPRHFSLKRAVRSAIASLVSITALWVLFGPVLGLMGSRTDVAMPFGQLLVLGVVINLVADYLSLIETRWLLGRFEHVRAWLLQLGLLVLDLAISALIIIAAISAFRLAQGERMLSPVEMLAGYTPYAVFFYSTFLTSVWAWAFSDRPGSFACSHGPG